MNIILESKKLLVLDIKRKTKAKMFRDVKVGDILQLSVPIEYVGSNRGRSYAVDIKVKNLNSGQVAYKTFNQITSLLNCFEIKEIDNKMAEDKVWIITNDNMEIVDVYSNKRSAEMYAEKLNEMAVANNFTVNKYDISN